jgi:hypothetical protein
MWRRIRQASGAGANIASGRDTYITVENTALQETATPEGQKPEAVMEICSKFLQAYEWHGVHKAEIPSFLEEFGGPHVTLLDVSSRDHLLHRLDDLLLEFTEATFVLHPDWLRQDNAVQVLRSLDFYKRVEGLARFLLVGAVGKQGRDELWRGEDRIEVGGSLYFFTTEEPSFEDPEAQDIAVGCVYRVPIGTFRGRLINRYFPLKALPWNYWRSRYQTVAMMSLADACEVGVVGKYLPSNQEVYDLCAGRRFPVEVSQRSGRPMDWWPRYPYFGPNAWSDKEDYKQRWSTYETYFEEQGYEATVSVAQAERERSLGWT